jgi:hypothetical protein
MWGVKTSEPLHNGQQATGLFKANISDLIHLMMVW